VKRRAVQGPAGTRHPAEGFAPAGRAAAATGAPGRRPRWRLAALALALLGLERPPGLGDVVEVRHWSYPEYTRVVVELTRPVETEVRRLPADPRAGRSERLYLDLDGVWVGRDHAEGIPVGDRLLRGVRLGQNTLRRTRVVLDLERYESHRLITLAHPHRVVIDVYGPRPAPPGGGAAGGGARLPAALRPVRTVVVDPGHGGRDPGAIGVGGLREKDVTLALARGLGRELERHGFRVVFTREGDRTLGLEERTAIAESVSGDVFVSIHANAARRRSLRGVETYYLNENHERHSLNLAARENGIPRSQVNELQHALARLQMEEIMPHSQRLARLVQERIVNGLPRPKRPEDLGVKKGPFYVLFLSNMPAVLIEAGFLTNRDDAARLRDSAYLGLLSRQIAEGLARYRDGGRAYAYRIGP
jgi:N-acetylmuramoyl-L-alanine amidase